MKSYSELIKLPTFEERYKYLRIPGKVGEQTFGSKRYYNQTFYHSREWKQFRSYIIDRDVACDMACKDHEIFGARDIIIHHINPIGLEDVKGNAFLLMDPENCICVTRRTHNAIHYGDETILKRDNPDRQPNDTCPWKV